MSLTYAAARELPPGQTLYDSRVPGLELRARATTKSFHVYYRTRAGRQRRPRIGAFPAMTVDRAREVARDILERVAKGEDPAGEWSSERAAPTMTDLCYRYLAEYAPKRKSAPAVAEDRRQIERMIIPRLGSVRVADLTIEAVERYLDDIEHRRMPCQQPKDGHKLRKPRKATAPSAAWHARALLSRLMTLAETRFKDANGQPWRTQGNNPVKGTKAPTPRPRRRFAQPGELPRIAAALTELMADYPAHVDAIRVLIYTGARASEITSARRQQIVGAELLITEHKTAQHIGEKRVPLPPPALAILHRRPYRADGRLFVLGVGEKGGANAYRPHGLRHVWGLLRKATGLHDITIHDVRRTYASVARALGHGLDDVGDIFGHTNPKTTKGYSWLFDGTAADVANTVAGELDRLMSGDGSSPSAAGAPAQPGEGPEEPQGPA